MKRISAGLCFGLCCVLIPQAQAEDWSAVIKTAQSTISVDMDAYDEPSGYPSIATKTVFKTPQPVNTHQPKSSYVEQRSSPQFNCATHQMRVPLIQMLDKKGKKIATDASQNQFRPVAAGSVESQLESLVCQVHKMVGGM